MSRKGRRRVPEDGATPLEVAQDGLRREAGHLRRLGGPAASCAVCGLRNFDLLTTAPRSLLEQHHLAGRGEGPTVVLCLNHHRILTARQMVGPSRFVADDRTELERIAALLDGRGAHLRALGESDISLGRYLLELSKALPPEEYGDIPSPFTDEQGGRND